MDAISLLILLLLLLCRVDAAVRCSVAGDFDLRIESSRSIGESIALGVLSVEGGSVNMDADLETWTPCRYTRSKILQALYCMYGLDRDLFTAVRLVFLQVFWFWPGGCSRSVAEW